MFLPDFYTLISLESISENKYEAIILLHKEHAVFKGHFPENPIMPGVCMVQIIKELTEKITGNSLFMESLTNAKFLALINPEIHPELRLELDITVTDEGKFKLKNTSYFNETVALKLSCMYKKSEFFQN